MCERSTGQPQGPRPHMRRLWTASLPVRYLLSIRTVTFNGLKFSQEAQCRQKSGLWTHGPWWPGGHSPAGRLAHFPSLPYHTNFHTPPLSFWILSLSLVQTPQGHCPLTYSLTRSVESLLLPASPPPRPIPNSPAPMSQFIHLSDRSCSNVPSCLCPFTGFALSLITLQLKWKLPPPVSFVIRLGLWLFETTLGKHHFHRIMSRMPTVNLAYH